MGDDTEMLELPLGDWHRAKGARMVPFASYAMPIQYEGIMAEHLWTRENAGLSDVSHMGQLILSGEGAAAALEKLVPGDISALKEGRMRYSLLLSEEGGVLDDLMVTAAPTGLYVVINGAVKHQDIAFLRANLPSGIDINHLEDRALLALQGRRPWKRSRVSCRALTSFISWKPICSCGAKCRFGSVVRAIPVKMAWKSRYPPIRSRRLPTRSARSPK